MPEHTHSYTSSVTKEATCETAGVRTYTCSCGHSYTQAIPATGHNYVDGTCTKCGATNPDYEEPDEPSTIEPVYQLAEPLTFDGTTERYNTGFALFEGEDDGCSIVMEFSTGDTPINSVLFQCTNGSNYYLRCYSYAGAGGNFVVNTCLGNYANIGCGKNVNNYKVVITKGAGSDEHYNVHYVSDGAITTTTATRGTGTYPANLTNKLTFGYDAFVGTIHDFKVYDVVLTEEQINAYLTATEDGDDDDVHVHNYVDGVCTSCGAIDPNYEEPDIPVIPDEPSTIEPVYQLAETSFDGTAGIDSGYILNDVDKDFSILIDFTSDTAGGYLFDATKNANKLGPYLMCGSGYNTLIGGSLNRFDRKT